MSVYKPKNGLNSLGTMANSKYGSAKYSVYLAEQYFRNVIYLENEIFATRYIATRHFRNATYSQGIVKATMSKDPE